ncbi:hypothetical protein [Methylobacterium gregans]|uniref:DUF5666 domain-containing protein n=1 Tax=Methylobacterium gregans TaxID=374424 RepID=A0AA37HUA9_9HYPH|nr:hypothetical protein [Methylobacterium gregans]MDQ0520471.1 hypothetical protein [Methylobacterium gregans]GJD81816.1 hypothetical protein NBEOAGPD_5070 [Methylobacterium gregans]GLS52270.1 hypothetical protein GCM10007886_04520 [Methylobacterium gregans]
MRHLLAGLVAGFLTALSPLLLGPAAADNPLARLRGTVEARTNDTLVLRPYTGGTVTTVLNPKTRIMIADRGNVRDIKPESYISVLSAPGDDADGVVIYSPSERGFEAGRQPWDTKPGATLTAGWIIARDGRDPVRVRLGHAGGEAQFALPAATAATRIAPGEKALLVRGAHVVVFTRTDASGVVNADTIVVGRQGVRPAL